MRRIAVLALVIFLLAPACMHPRRPLPYPGGTVIGRSDVPSFGNPPRPQPAQCAEVARFRCSAAHCGGFRYDFVTVQCAGEPIRGYCQANGGCQAK